MSVHLLYLIFVRVCGWLVLLSRSSASKDAERVVQDHRSWYVGRAERADREWAGPPQAQWIEQLRVEHANIRAALGGPCHQCRGGRAAA